MKRLLLEVLACPLCHGTFSLKLPTGSVAGEDVVAGTLTCSGCGACFPVSDGIPRLLPSLAAKPGERPPSQESGARRTAATFGYEFSHFSQPTVEENRLLFFRKTGIDPSIYRVLKNASEEYSLTLTSGYEPKGDFLEGKLVLELGCGPGRFAAVARDYARDVVALDLSGAVDVARERYAHFENLHFVQGDILEPPLRPGSFDFVYSLGVLHHTQSTSRAFQTASSLCKPDGHLAVWVYPPSYWNDVIRGSVAKTLRLVTARLSPRMLHVFCWLLYPLGKLQTGLAKSRWGKVLGAPFFLIPVPRDQARGIVDLGVIYDYYSPHYIWTHTPEEVFDWYVEHGFDDIRILPVPTALIGRKAR